MEYDYNEAPRPRVIILADGRTKEDHLDNSRLLTNIGGQRLIVRTVQQFGRWANVVVLTSDPTIKNAVRGQKNMIVVQSRDESRKYFGIDMIRKGLEHAWTRKSFIVFGDVVWTDEAVATLECHQIADFAVYGRSGASEVLGTPYAEYFGIGLNWKSREDGKRAVEEVANFYRTGSWDRCTAWEWYRHMEGMPYAIKDPANVEVGEHWVEINDATDDIDTVDDIERLRKIHG